MGGASEQRHADQETGQVPSVAIRLGRVVCSRVRPWRLKPRLRSLDFYLAHSESCWKIFQTVEYKKEGRQLSRRKSGVPIKMFRVQDSESRRRNLSKQQGRGLALRQLSMVLVPHRTRGCLGGEQRLATGDGEETESSFPKAKGFLTQCITTVKFTKQNYFFPI